MSETNVSDLSPIAGLINLRNFGSWGSPLIRFITIWGIKKDGKDRYL